MKRFSMDVKGYDKEDFMSQCEVCGGENHAKRRQFKECRAFLCDNCHGLAKRRFNPYRGKKRRRVHIPKRQEWIAALKSAWNDKRKCFECRISHVQLDIEDKGSPFYATCEHVTPSSGAAGWLIVAAVINDMKSDLDLEEFHKVLALLLQCMPGPPEFSAVTALESVIQSLKHWRR